MRSAYARLARWLFRHRRTVLGASVALLLLALPAAIRAPTLLQAGAGQLPGTDSARVEHALAREFDHPLAHSLAVTFHSANERIDDPEFRAALDAFATALRSHRALARVVVPDDQFGPQFRAADGHTIAVLLGLRAAGFDEAQTLVPTVRAAVRAAWPAAHFPAWELRVTGRAALNHDLGVFNARDSQAAELRALPLTLIVLVVVFGSFVAAGLPLLLGVASTLVALACVPALTAFVPLNIFYQNIISLLGLALGVDYSLFLVNRYQEERAAGAGPEDALAATLATTGVAITYSGCTVLIGLAGLLATPLFELRSIGYGGLVVVGVSVAFSLTLLPALLVTFNRWLDAPRQLSTLLSSRWSESRWEAWMAFVLRRPFACLLAGLIVLLALSAPLLQLQPGFPDRPWLPAAMESSEGFAALQRIGVAQEAMPVLVVVRATDGGPLLPRHLDQLVALSDELWEDPRVARVFGPVDLAPKVPRFLIREFYQDAARRLAEQPELAAMILSRDHTAGLLQIVLRDDVTYSQCLELSRELAERRVPGLTLTVGGHWPACRDFDAVLLKAYPLVFGSVIAATFLVLALAFRSLLVPVKALALNALSVTAAFGALVAVFQWGWGAAWLGLDGPTGAVPLIIPVIVFCLTFGLSMDYEVMILARVREEFIRDPHGDRSVRRGLVATGRIISGAAAIMVVVFGAFALAGVVVVKMFGFGLAVAVAVDALIVRALMVPAAMKLAGRWNWWPGLRGPPPPAAP